MANRKYLRLVTHVLLVVLICNVFLKLLSKYLLVNLIHWLMACPSGECSEIKWWQRVPAFEKAVWRLLDYVEN